MQVSALSSTARSLAGSAAGSTSPGAIEKQQTLNQKDFLKLLSVQFQSQDPMKPMDDTAFIAQMAQFTSLEQTSTMSSQLARIGAAQDAATASSYLGRQLTVDDGYGGTTTGQVSAVDASGSTPQLIIDGQPYPLSAVLRVEPGAISTSAPQPPLTGGA